MTDSQQTIPQKEISEFGSSTKSNKIKTISASITIKSQNLNNNSPEKLISSNGNNKVLDIKSSLSTKNEASITMSQEIKEYYSRINQHHSEMPISNLQDSAIKSKIDTFYEVYQNLEQKKFC